MVPAAVGTSIPPDTFHAVSVSLPTWKANIGYEEGEEWVMSKMKTGYPRFFIHKSIQKLAQIIVQKFGAPGEAAMVLPSLQVAERCLSFMQQRTETTPIPNIRTLELACKSWREKTAAWTGVAAVLFPLEEFKVAKQFWQHTGEGISSRQAEFCLREYEAGLVEKSSAVTTNSDPPSRVSRGPKRYSRVPAKAEYKPVVRTPEVETGVDCSRFVEERFGRNLDLAFIDSAKLAIRRRIAGTLKSNVGLQDALGLSNEGGRLGEGFSENDVYLYPTGMSAIYNAHRLLTSARGPKKSVCYGFPYIDTLKILEKFGPGCHFFGHGSAKELDELEAMLQSGEEILGLFCEFPSNPLLKSPNMIRIHELADKYDFAVVVDETVGNFLNVHVLPYVDAVVSSLTKVFSGDSNVMGGSMVLNPNGRYYKLLKEELRVSYEDNYWGEDALFLERNSRDFVSRIDRINKNAETISDVLRNHPRVKEVYYPKYSSTRDNYDVCRCSTGGYGGLLSIIFYTNDDAIEMFDALETAKGPSLGTNFTLCCPYTLLAHYGELEWAAQFGVHGHLIRISVGLEETEELVAMFERALATL